jgi:hypothetical protein
LQIRAGSTLHPFSTFTSVEPPPPPLGAVCEEQAAATVDTTSSKTSDLRCIETPPCPKKMDLRFLRNLAARYLADNKL